MDTEKICRCCLALDVPLLSIYDGGSAGMGCVADMLKQIAKLLPQPTDNMPEKACLQCISEINRCYVFKIKCENSNRTLRQLLPDAVPETLDIEPKKVLVTSSSVQTDDKMLISSMVQTVGEVSNSSVQTVEEEKPFLSHKGIQTENESEDNIVIYEEIDNSSEIVKKRTQPSPVSTHVKKKLCLEKRQKNDVLAVEESESTTQEPSAYILLEDSNCSEEPDIFIQSPIENQKDSEGERFEYYENEEETQNDQKSFIYRDDPNENEYTNNVFEVESTEGFTKSSEESEASINPVKSNIFTRASNRPKGQYKCSHCIMTFVSIKVLKRHLANRHSIKDADLIIDYLPAVDSDKMSNSVGQSSDKTAKLSNYDIELTSENVAKPQLTPRERVTSALNEKVLPGIKYFCDYCQAGFAQRKTLTYHIKHQVCMASNFKCNICGSIFVSEENLKTHKLTHENPHKCLECDTVCKTIDELSQHMIKNHNRSARNQCHVCKKVFTMRTSLMDHLRIHSGEKPFLCTICGKSFRQNSNLRQHLIRHTNEKNYKCDMCPNAYVTKAELFSHKRTHTGDHPFKCDICEARFTTSCSLKKHIRKHTGERPYACEFCPMRFAALNVLKNHRRIHTGEKPFKCAHCPRSFTQKGDCLMHERTHINNEYFKCFCESKFSKKSNLTHHIKTQHPDFNEKEIQTLLDKSVGDNSNTKYQITLMEDTEEKFATTLNDDNENDIFVEIAVEKESPNNNEELLELVMQDVG